MDVVIRRIISESGQIPVLTPPGTSGYVQPNDDRINAAFQSGIKRVSENSPLVMAMEKTK